jgi:plastocyanin
MRKPPVVFALALLALAAGCGADDAGTTATATSSAASSAPASSEAAESSAAPAPASSSAAAAPTVLTGSVGTPEDPDAFVISLTDSSGQPVTSLPAGDYSIQVQDPSDIHNFHLTGGSVDETTTVPEVTETTFEVTLTPGEYEFVCDPHARMRGSFTVT